MLSLMIMFFLFMITCLLLTNFNYMISYKKKINRKKNTPFECGFMPFNSSRIPLSIQFYLISMIFLIFDIEIIILFPWMLTFNFSIFFNNETFLLFMMILLLSLYIEWNDGALNWIK